MTRILILALPLLMLACGTSKKTTDQMDASSMIKMVTGPCFGTCPVFEITIDGTGKATYLGKRFVEKEGSFAKTFSEMETKHIFQRFLDADFFSFEDEYTEDVTDLPTTWLTFEHKGKTKTIRCYYGTPDLLVELIKDLHSYGETEGWEATSKE